MKSTDTLKSGYRFDRVNSKGKVIFRRDTNETLEDVEKYLKSKGIEYEVKKGASMLWIEKDKLYAYYYTTGRWHPRVENSYPKKHYRSNGIDDFITRFTKDSKNREDALRTCRDCNTTAKTEEELNLFVVCKRHTHNRRNLCYKCENKRDKKWRDNNSEVVLFKRQKHYATKAYGITLEEYQKRMSSSNKCQVCGSKDSLCYDHDHKTMRFRGVLCNKCNRSIGQLGDTAESIEKVLFYLNKEEQRV